MSTQTNVHEICGEDSRSIQVRKLIDTIKNSNHSKNASKCLLVFAHKSSAAFNPFLLSGTGFEDFSGLSLSTTYLPDMTDASTFFWNLLFGS